MNQDTHIYLYAKGHYIKSDVTQDLKQIVAQRSAMNPKMVSNYDILCVLSEIVYKHIDSEHKFVSLMFDMKDCQSGYPDIFECLLALLVNVKATGLDLGSPDKSILPLRNV